MTVGDTCMVRLTQGLEGMPLLDVGGVVMQADAAGMSIRFRQMTYEAARTISRMIEASGCYTFAA